MRKKNEQKFYPFINKPIMNKKHPDDLTSTQATIFLIIAVIVAMLANNII